MNYPRVSITVLQFEQITFRLNSMEPEDLVVQNGQHNANAYSSDHRDLYNNNLYVDDDEIQFLT